MSVDVKALAKASKKEGEAKKKEDATANKADKQQQRKQSMRKWSDIMIGSIQKPLAKTTSAPPTANLTAGSFKSPGSDARSLKTQMTESAALKVDGSPTKAPLHSILKQQASGIKIIPGDYLDNGITAQDLYLLLC